MRFLVLAVLALLFLAISDAAPLTDAQTYAQLVSWIAAHENNPSDRPAVAAVRASTRWIALNSEFGPQRKK